MEPINLLLPEDQKLIQEAQEAIARVKARWSKANTPDPSLMIFSDHERQKRVDQKLAEAERENRADLENIMERISARQKAIRQTIREKLHPLETATGYTGQDNRMEAYAIGQKASTTVRAVGVSEALDEEYTEAMEDPTPERTEYATDLIETAERMIDPDELDQSVIVDRLKSRHILALGLTILLKAKPELKATGKEVESYLRMVQAGYRKDLDQATDLGELDRMLRAGGLTA